MAEGACKGTIKCVPYHFYHIAVTTGFNRVNTKVPPCHLREKRIKGFCQVCAPEKIHDVVIRWLCHDMAQTLYLEVELKKREHKIV